MKDPEVPELSYPNLGISDESKSRPVRPWDIFNKNVEKVARDIQQERLAICMECPRLIKATKQCKECGCFMEIKTKLFDADCPLDKWDSIIIDRDQFDYKDN